MPAWFAASVNVFHCNVTGCDGVSPGSILDEPTGNVTDAPNVSLPVNSLRISAPAALNALCPELYSGKGGVGNVLRWYGAGLKAAYAGVVFWNELATGIPAFWIPWAWADLSFLVLFLLAWNRLRSRT